MSRAFIVCNYDNMEIIELHQGNIDSRAIERAVALLRRGELVIYPTDSHPAVGADALDVASVADLCRLKGVNPAKHTLTLVCASIAQASQYARIDNRAFQVLRDNTPGPFTFILPPASSLPKAFKGRKQVGIRIPDNDIARQLAEALGNPLLSGSLGSDDPSDYDNNVSLLLADASARFDAEPQSSAVVDLMDSSSPEIIREGPVALC